jgi:hypothetical protein
MRKNLVNFHIETRHFLAIAGLIIAALSAEQLALAQQDQDRGLIGNYQDGYQSGLAAGAADYRDGYSKYASCPGGTLDYCAGYTVGYNEGYEAARKVG